jgi:phospholipid/cholesterol/gamma-HCH transport system substrate-binding protein
MRGKAFAGRSSRSMRRHAVGAGRGGRRELSGVVGARQRRWAAGPVVAAAALLLSGCALSLQSLPKVSSLSASTYPIYAEFANVLNLPVEAQVREGAEVVGQVGSISTSNYQADLTLDIKRSVRLLVGTTAQVRFDDPLGDEYVLLQEPPAGEELSLRFLAPRGRIPEESTSTAPSVEDTFGALSLVLNGGGINQLQTIIGQLNNTFNGNQTPIHSFLTTIDNGVSSLAGGRVAIDNALASISGLSNKLNGGGGTIATGISTITPAIAVLAGETQQISGLLTQLTNLGTIGTQVAQESGQNSVDDVDDLLPVVQQLNAVSAQLGPDLDALARFEAETPKIAPGDYLQVNAIVNVLLPPGGFEPTPLGSAQTTADTTPQSSHPLEGGAAVSDLLADSLW